MSTNTKRSLTKGTVMNFSVVQVRKGREVGRSGGMTLPQALKIARARNNANPDLSWNGERNCCYVEETVSVKHLPVTIKT
jgi:hypothetical protein